MLRQFRSHLISNFSFIRPFYKAKISCSRFHAKITFTIQQLPRLCLLKRSKIIPQALCCCLLNYSIFFFANCSDECKQKLHLWKTWRELLKSSYDCSTSGCNKRKVYIPISNIYEVCFKYFTIQEIVFTIFFSSVKFFLCFYDFRV